LGGLKNRVHAILLAEVLDFFWGGELVEFKTVMGKEYNSACYLKGPIEFFRNTYNAQIKKTVFCMFHGYFLMNALGWLFTRHGLSEISPFTTPPTHHKPRTSEGNP